MSTQDTLKDMKVSMLKASTQDTTLPPLPDERAAFEAWYAALPNNGRKAGLTLLDAWQARAAIAAQAQPPGFSPMWLAPIDGTPVMLYMPTTTNKFAVGQWHGSPDSIIGNWGDDEGNYYVHTPVSFMALSNLERIANPQAAVKESLTHQQAQQAQGVSPDRVFQLADAHAEESYENGDRRFDRGGLIQFAKELLAAAPQADHIADASKLVGQAQGVPASKEPHNSNDKEPRDPDSYPYLDARGDDRGQGLSSYWKWGYAAGWNDHKKHATRTAAPQAEPQIGEKALTEALEERDAASDYIDTLLDEVLGADRPEWTSNYGHADAMDDVRQRMADLQASATQAEPQPDKLAISPLEEQQMFDDWCPYKGNPDPRVVWAAAIDAANGMLAGIGTKGGEPSPSVSGDPPGSYNNWTGAEVDELHNVLDDVFSDGGTKGGDK